MVARCKWMQPVDLALLITPDATCAAGDPDGVLGAPNEVDTMLSTDWFGSHLRPLPDLVRCYYNSVGNSAQLLMNVSTALAFFCG